MRRTLEEGVWQFKIISNVSEKIVLQRPACRLWVRQPPLASLAVRPFATYAPSLGSGSAYVKQEQSIVQTPPQKKVIERIK